MRRPEARSAKFFFLILTESASTAMARARGAKRENFFLHSDGWREQSEGAGTRREARNFFLHHSDKRRKHSEGAGTRHEARKKFVFLILTEGAGTAPRKEKIKKKKEKKNKKICDAALIS